jgi:hypothetical protein
VDVGNPYGAAHNRFIRAQIEMLLAVGHHSIAMPLCNSLAGGGNKLFTLSPNRYLGVTEMTRFI